MSRNGPAQPKGARRLLDVERFERVVAPGATALLRLTGRLLSRGGVDVDAPVLVVDGEHRFAPLPGPAPLGPGHPGIFLSNLLKGAGAGPLL